MATEPLPWPIPIQHGQTEAVDFIGSLLWSMVNEAKIALVPTPNRIVHIIAGRNAPHDDSCSQLAGRVLTITPLTGPKGATAAPCGVTEYIATLGLQIYRCIATLNDNGDIPSEREMDMDGLQMTRDLANLLKVIQCHDAVRTIGAWTPIEARGGVAGGEWTFQVRIPVCPCTDHYPAPTGMSPIVL